MAETTTPTDTRPIVLLADANVPLRELEQLVLENAGYRVEIMPEGTAITSFAQQLRPQVIVLSLPWNDPGTIAVVDQLQANETTRVIPVVTISTSEQTVATAQAAPNVRESVIAPYDIDALEAAVQSALHHPPPTAVLPVRQSGLPPAVRFATGEMTRQARTIVIGALRTIRHVEPYRSRFPELSLGLVNDLGTILGAIVHGLERGLTPTEVFATPTIRESIDKHIHLRQTQNLGPAAAIHEDHILEQQIDSFLTGLIGQSGFTSDDALAMVLTVRDFEAELTRIIVGEYNAQVPEQP